MGRLRFQRAQAGQIEVIHMGVRKQHDIGPRHFPQRKRREHETLHADSQRPEVQTDTLAEDGIRQNRDAIELEQHGAVPEPCGVQAVVGPTCGIRRKGRGGQRPFALACILLPQQGDAAEPEFPSRLIRRILCCERFVVFKGCSLYLF